MMIWSLFGEHVEPLEGGMSARWVTAVCSLKDHSLIYSLYIYISNIESNGFLNQLDDVVAGVPSVYPLPPHTTA